MKAVARTQQPHRGQEHEFEAQHGLPERLPPGEQILWQGSPDPVLVGRRVFHLVGLALYFAAMLTWRMVVLLDDGADWSDALRGTLLLAVLSASALGFLAYMAWLTAKTTVYTVTNQRVVMRIGIVLTVTYNLPLRSIDAAHLLPLSKGRGEIALALRGDTRIAYLHLWPHARPWQLARTQPMLRCLADVQPASALLVQAWAEANAQAARPAAAPAQQPEQQGLSGLTPHGSAA
jgi:hypothetical protein